MKVAEFAHRALASFLGLALINSFSTTLHAADYYVDPNYAGVNGAPYLGYAAAYNNIDAALASTGGVPAGSSAATPNRLFFAPGTYNTGTTSLSYSKANVALIGLDGNPNDVVITSTLDSAYITSGTTTIGTSGSASLQLKGNNQSAMNITFANSTDTPYIVNSAHMAVSPTGSYVGTNSQTANAPAVALLLQGDEQAFSNCDFLGYQDTLYTKGGRAYFTGCYVSGDVDFIFANGTDVFNNSTINMDGDHSGGDITAASTDKRTSNGIVFLNSTITSNSVKGNSVLDPFNAANANGAAANSMYLGRPWGWTQTGGDASTVLINTMMTSAIKAAGWLAWDSKETQNPPLANTNNGNPMVDSRYAEYNSMDLMGNPLNVSGRVSWSQQLTAAQAADYTVANLFADSPDTWYGLGYSGVADPTNPNYSWPAFWGPRNNQNETTNSIVTGNPTSYSNPSWTLGGNWDPNSQLEEVPEPASFTLLAVGGLFALTSRRRSRTARLAA